MPISILANITIELFATMSWWIIKNTFTGIYYLVFRNNKKTTYINVISVFSFKILGNISPFIVKIIVHFWQGAEIYSLINRIYLKFNQAIGIDISLNLIDFCLLLMYISSIMVKRVWQPKKRKRVKKHGFLSRMFSKGGRKVLKRRLAKGRKVLVRSLFRK